MSAIHYDGKMTEQRIYVIIVIGTPTCENKYNCYMNCNVTKKDVEKRGIKGLSC